MENLPNTYSDLFLGYTIIWTIFGAYILYLGCKIRKLEKLVNSKATKE